MIRKLCYKHSFLSLITLFGICTLVYGVAFYLFPLLESTDSSNLGDASTFATGLVSCFAISGGVLAVFLQHLELSLQRRELKNTRIELHNQKEEISKQTAIFKEEQFAQIFSNMFQIYKNSVANINGIVIEGIRKEKYKSMEYLFAKLNEIQLRIKKCSSEDEKEIFIKENMEIFCECYSLFYTIFRFVVDSNLSIERKKFYLSIIQNVSNLELLCLALYSLTNNKDDFNILENNNIFDNLSRYIEINKKSNAFNLPDSYWFDIYKFLDDNLHSE